MILSRSSRYLLDRIELNGGSIEVKGNRRSGDALLTRKLVKVKSGRYILTATGRKWLDKN